ncbi:hypothetical protein ACNKHV_19890 [Shigella flexneri]
MKLVIGWRWLQCWIVGRHAESVVALRVIGLPVKAIPEPPLTPARNSLVEPNFRHNAPLPSFLPLLRKRIGYAIAQ